MSASAMLSRRSSAHPIVFSELSSAAAGIASSAGMVVRSFTCPAGRVAFSMIVWVLGRNVMVSPQASPLFTPRASTPRCAAKALIPKRMACRSALVSTPVQPWTVTIGYIPLLSMTGRSLDVALSVIPHWSATRATQLLTRIRLRLERPMQCHIPAVIDFPGRCTSGQSDPRVTAERAHPGRTPDGSVVASRSLCGDWPP